MANDLSLVGALSITRGTFSFLEDSPVYKTEKPYIRLGALSPEQEKFRTNLKYRLRTDIPVHKRAIWKVIFTIQ
jgi:hypothetical protein